MRHPQRYCPSRLVLLEPIGSAGKAGFLHSRLIARRPPFGRSHAQHTPYLLKQLLVIESALRTAPVMHGIIKDLNREQMEAVAAYLESI